MIQKFGTRNANDVPVNYTVASPFKILVLNFKNYDNAHHANPSIKEYDHTGNSKTVWEAG